MKHALFLFLFLIIHGQAVGQQTRKPVVSIASYFDISPLLRTLSIEHVKKSDQSWKFQVVKNYFKPTDSFITKGFYTDSTVQTLSGMKTGDTILQNFEGIPNLNMVAPPDPCGDVGPDHYFQMVNFTSAIYNKEGTSVLGPFNSGRIWNGMPHNSNNGDGIVLYDENATRWFISQLSLPDYPNGPYYQMIAVSQTPDPTGSWFRWEYPFSDIPDYPKFGIWCDGYYMSYNRIRAGGMPYDGTGAAVFDRAAMLVGDPASRMVLFLLNSAEDAFSMIPADCDGDFPDPGTPEFFFFIKRNYLGVLEFHTDWNNLSNSTFGNYLHIPVSPFANNIENIPQKGTGSRLNPINDRLMFRLQFRKFNDHQSMVVNHTVDAGERTGIRWYELRRNTENWYIHQQSTFSPDSNFRWMGSVAMDKSGNIALGYSVSGPNIYPSVRYSGRMCHDPLGNLTITEKEIIAGGGAQTGAWGSGGRWGDYSSMNVDPNEAQTFWYTQEYYDSTTLSNWKTRIASFSFANIMIMNATAMPNEICMNGTTGLNIEASGGTGNYTYEWRSLPAGFSSNIKDPIVMPAKTTKYIARVSDGLSVCIDTVSVLVLTLPSVESGRDTSYCHYTDTVTLQGCASNIISNRWTTSGDGIFDDETSLNTLYFPGINDKSHGSVDLKLRGIPQPPCFPVSSLKHITFEPCEGTGEYLVCNQRVEVFPNPSHGQFSIRLIGFPTSPVTFQILNPAGNFVLCKILDHPGSSQIFNFKIPQSTSGIFIIKVISDDVLIFKKIILLK